MTDESHNGIVESSELENNLPPHPDGPDNHGEEEFDSRLYVVCRSLIIKSFSLKHVMVFTMSGKPVWSRYGSEETNSALVGILFTIYSILDETDDQIGEIELGQGRRLVYFISDPIILVSIGFGQTRQLRNELSIGLFGTAGIRAP